MSLKQPFPEKKAMYRGESGGGGGGGGGFGWIPHMVIVAFKCSSRVEYGVLTKE